MKYDAIILTDTKTPHRVRPLGAYVIANSLREEGYSCLVLDFFTHMKKEKLLGFLEKFIGENTVFVGYSSSLLLNSDSKFQYLGVDVNYFVEINSHIKKLNSKTKIVFGGAYTSHLSDYCLKNQDNLGVDYLMHGYSESMIVDFVERCKKGLSQKFSKKNYGLYEIEYDYEGKSFDFCDKKHFWHNDDLVFNGESLPLELSRGCIFKCKFCAYPLLGKNKNDFTYLKTEENILEEILSNYDRFKTLNYQIIDDTFNERTEKLEILLRVRDRSKLDLTFVGYNRLDLIHRFPEQISLFKNLNFRGHFFGIESFNHESAKIIGKGLKEVRATETLLKIKESLHNVNITAGFILGLPKETMKTFSDWFSKVFQPDYPIDSIILNPLWISKTTHTKSEFFSNPEKYGYSFEKKNFSDIYESPTWRNQYWSQQDCTNVVNDLRKVLKESGRNKIPSFYSIGLCSLEKDFYSFLNIPFKNVDYEYYEKKLYEKVDDYVAKLESL